MPFSVFRRSLSPDTMSSSFNTFDASMKDATPLLNFEDAQQFPADNDPMIFGPLELEEHLYDPVPPQPFPSWDPYSDMDADIKPSFGFSSTQTTFPSYDYGFSPASPTSPLSPGSSFFESHTGLYSPGAMKKTAALDANSYLSNWINDPDMISSSSPSSPITIPSGSMTTHPSFASYLDQRAFSPISPTSYAANLPLPASVDSSPSFEEAVPYHRQSVDAISPMDMSLQPPRWASQLWENSSTLRTHSSPTRPSVRHSPLSDLAQRQRIPIQREAISTGQIFQSASAPSPTHLRAPSMTRSYSRRAESSSVSDDRDATIRRKKRVSIPADEPQPADKASNDTLPLKSVLRPPKLAPSAWQLYFTDWIQRQQASNTRKLNVAQAAKEAGQEYASLTPEEKEPYKRKSQAMKDARERDLAAYMRTLSPDDIKRENAFRTAQRKLGKSRKSNIKDPNAPKKPLSAYFMFLQRIRANPSLVHDIFGDETETTKQSVLAAAKWRSMSDEERKPFLAQAEQEKMEYEAARRLYEEGTASPYGSNINFSILPAASPVFGTVKLESESESEGFTTDDGADISRY
ncbi:exp1-like protein [Pleurotus pulmonarius]|nr:exp1-like protein [Pleurotus pulmonarius]